MGQQLASIEHLAAARSKNGITAFCLTSNPQKILLTAIELKLSLKRVEPMGLQIGDQALTMDSG